MGLKNKFNINTEVRIKYGLHKGLVGKITRVIFSKRMIFYRVEIGNSVFVFDEGDLINDNLAVGKINRGT